MKKFCSIVAALSMALAMALPLSAQIQTPAASPTVELKTKVGLTDVSLLYSRPSIKGRTVFAAAKTSVVPFGTMWRTGANSATKISFSDDVTIGGTAIKKGDYAIFSTPGATEWKVMFFNYETTNAGGYGDKTAVATWTLKPQKLAEKVETFTIDINDQTMDKASINIIWENTKVSMPLSVDVEGKVKASIDRVLAGPSANDYFTAGSYYHDTKKDLNKALEWVQKANAMSPQFWTLRKESLILADLGKKKEAIEVAMKSLAAAKEAKNQDYINMNEASIAEWKK
ncbi:DUF2911 domain-containing protein [Haliscomenobacter hydrossis]|uniref:DUF2911 domain-containing protein n=1 Tax=Haliscomenobacter hydrossis (strain ATCC 27775 / DSM 1100 / LMG 10767 / O) TaxID=760192 RepID=F4L1U5_HALH1|nr:DUF2911 domain-containing protein [Haliscomenobacter hydrossis]AEE49604.1 hypothetical protein Halhy_1715 [Haliscomenobacter hydrossis DSM 1100]